jgi:glucosylceramidase
MKVRASISISTRGRGPASSRHRLHFGHPMAVHTVVALSFVILGLACTKDEAPVGSGIVCPGDQMPCGLQCLSVMTDPMNCGGCGIPCSAGQICLGGACQCESGVLCNGACVPADTTPCGTAVSTLVISTPGAYWNTDGELAPVTSGTADVTVNETATAQTWEGFGGAFNEMGWHYLSMLSPSDQDTAIQLLYGADGARFAFGRIPIGASDYAMDRYTLDETPHDTSLENFSIDRDKQWLIPFVKAAQAVKANIRFWASPWTPPTWMKQGPFSSGKAVSPFDGGSMKDDDVTLAAFAQYLIKFVQAYTEQGIPIEAISAQNEPNYTGNYPTCAWTPAIYAKFIGQHLGPAVASAGLTTKIVLGTFNGGGSDPAIVSSVLGYTTARNYINVLGFQWGMLSKVADSKWYDLPIWQSEHKCGNYPWVKPFDATMAPNDQTYAVESWGLIRDWIKAGVTAYSAWNMVLDTVGVGIDTTRVWPQNALLTVDTSTKTLNITPTYYVFRHFSQFVAQGAKVVSTSGGDSVAFKNPDGSVVVVLYNSGSAKTMTVATATKKLQFSVPGNGWATVVAR